MFMRRDRLPHPGQFLGCVAKNLSGMGRTRRPGSLVSSPRLESGAKQFSDEPCLAEALPFVHSLHLPFPDHIHSLISLQETAVRSGNGQRAMVVLISTLTLEDLGNLASTSPQDPQAFLRALVSFYDQRGGGVKTSFKGDKQGLGMVRRNKKRFEAQQIVMLLGSLAHNVILWTRHWLAESASSLQCYGMLRMVRDVFHISGFFLLDT